MIGGAEDIEALAVDFTDDPHGEPRPGDRLAPDHALGQSQLEPDTPDLVLEEIAQWLDQGETQIGRKAANVVVGLDPRSRADGVVARALDHVRVQRPLGEKVDLSQLFRFRFEDTNELLADNASLGLGIGYPLQPGQEAILGVDRDELSGDVRLEHGAKLLTLVLAQQPVVDKDADEMVADRSRDERGRDRAVDPAAERAQDASGTNLFPDRADALLDERTGRPARAAAADVAKEVLENRHTARRMHDLRMKEQPKAAVPVAHGREGRVLGSREGGKSRRKGFDPIAVAHPHPRGRRDTGEQGVRLIDKEIRGTKFSLGRRLDGASERVGHELHPITDPKDGDVGGEDARIATRRLRVVDAGWTAGEN